MFHIKTDAGREEIRARQLKLSRSARTLLLILEPSKPTEEWMQMVRGATLDDVQGLLQLGLIASRDAVPPPAAATPQEPEVGDTETVEIEFELPAVAPVRAAASSAAPEPAAAPAAPAAAAVVAPAAAPAVAAPAPPAAPSADFSGLSQRLTQLATRHLGLLESYRMVLEIERCAGVAELQALAPKLLAAVERSAGAEKAQRLRAELGAGL